VSSQQNPCRSERWITYDFAKLRIHAVYNSFDQRPWSEVLTGSALRIARVFLQKALVGVTFEVGRESRPLTRRARLLNDGTILSLGGGVCATLLLAALFASQFFGLKHVYGAGVLFFVATLLLGVALFRFAHEAWLARRELKE
jgi:hypothetical protein